MTKIRKRLASLSYRQAVTRAVTVQVEVLRSRRQTRDASGNDVTHPDLRERRHLEGEHPGANVIKLLRL
jgi:hypothetical protein